MFSFNIKKKCDVFFERISRITTTSTLVANSIHKQHNLVFPKYKNINYGKEVVIVATGESVKRYTPITGAVHIGLNRAVLLDSIKFDYFFLQDYSGAKDYIEKINNYNPNICRKFYGRMMSSKGVEHCIIPDYQIEKANAELYYTSYPNKVFHYDISSFPLADFHTVANSAFHFALWTHPTKIYLVGCDCSSTYFDGSKGKSFSYLIDGWKKAKQFADLYYPDIEVTSINPVGLAGLFKDMNM